MINCAEKLLSVFAPSTTVGEVANSMSPGKGTIYDVLIHVMRKYGAYTNTVEEMLKDIRSRHGMLGLPSSSSSSSRPSTQAASSSSQPVAVKTAPTRKTAIAPMPIAAVPAARKAATAIVPAPVSATPVNKAVATYSSTQG